MRWDGPSTRAFLCRLTAAIKRNSLSRFTLRPVAVSATIRRSPSPVPCEQETAGIPGLAADDLRRNTGSTVCTPSSKRSAAGPRLVPTSVAWTVPGKTDGWVCDLGARVVDNPAAPGRSAPSATNGCHAQSQSSSKAFVRVNIASSRRHTSLGTAPTLSMVSSIIVRRSLLLIRSLVGGPRRHDHLVKYRWPPPPDSCTACMEVQLQVSGMDAGLRIGTREVIAPQGLVAPSGHTQGALTTFGPSLASTVSAAGPAPRLRAPPWRPVSSPTDPLERKPTPPAGHLHACLCRTAGLPRIIRCLAILSQQLRYLRRQLRCLLLHPLSN